MIGENNIKLQVRIALTPENGILKSLKNDKKRKLRDGAQTTADKLNLFF